MPLRNTHKSYGVYARLLHWTVALTTLALFGVGLWMTQLTYYDPWYNRAPWLHKGVGSLLLAVALIQVLWRWADTRPVPVVTGWERRLAAGMHRLLITLVLAVCASGYLMVTADGSPLVVLDMLEIPAVDTGIARMADRAGAFHYYAAWTLVILAAGHAGAALKHHFVDRDATLRRMIAGR